ncbi:MAG: hypothetical protein WBX01_09145 [Nitrososphaeraceae archaeon]
MPRIIVDRDELERVRDSLDDLLEKGTKQGTARSAEQQPVYNSNYKLDEKETKIVEYVKQNPGRTKEDVVKNLKDYSRMTVLRAIARLLDRGVIIATYEHKRSRITHLYVNVRKEIFSIGETLGVFQYSYSEFIDEAIGVIESKLSGKGGMKYKAKMCMQLVYKLTELYKFVSISYITSDIFLWSKRPLDNDTLHYKFEHFFHTMKEIHYKLLEMASRLGLDHEEAESMVCNMMVSSDYRCSKVDLFNMLKYFEKINLSNALEPVVDAFWALSYPILPLIDLSYRKHQKNGTLKDWRNMFKGIYQPRTKQWVFPEVFA